MGTNKLIQKSLKLTAVGAIAFSVLAQPLSLVASAAEATSTKSERQLLQATTQEELLTNSKLDFVDDYPADTQFFDGWRLRNVSNTDDLTSPNSVGSAITIHKDSPYTNNYWVDVPYGSSDFGVIGVNNVTTITGDRELYLNISTSRSTGTYGAIAVYQDVTTEVGKEYTLSQSGTYTAEDYLVNVPVPSSGAIPKSRSINVFASNASSKERLALIKATDTNQSTTFVAQSTKTRIYAIIGVQSFSRIDRNVMWQSTDAAGNNLFGVSLKASSTGTSEAKTATDALFVDNDPTKGIKPSTDQAAIDAAQAKIDLVTDTTAKAELQAELDKAQAALDARTAEAQHEAEAKAATEGLFVDNDATKGIKPATDQAAIDAAQAKIDEVTDATVKAELQADLDKAQAELDARTAEAQREAEAKAATNGLFVDNDTTKGIKPATDQAAIDAAQAKIDEVTDATVKAELQADLDKAQAELDARTAEAQREAEAKAATNGLFVDNDTTKGIKPATDQAAIDAAQAKIDNVTDATVKAELQADLDKAQAALDARTAEAQREAAAKAAINDLFISNNPANNIKDTTTQAAIDAAQTKVNAITDPTVKAELQAQIDKAQAQINARTPIDGTVAKYTAGDLNITGTYTGPATALSLDINGKRYYGGTIANGTFKFYVGDKNLKPSDVVTLNLYDANKQIQKSITVTVVEALKITIADYKIGDNYLTATYNYPEITKVGIVVDGTKYWGGDVKDGNVKFFAADKIKNANADVTMNFYDASNNLIASKKVTIATASAEISTANYTVGATNITGTFAGDIRKLAVSINGTKYYGGSLTTNGTYKFYVLDKKIKATDTVIVYGYDANGGLLSQQTVTITE
ncbi:immunoglobulin-like domain-containing protein [Listeria booriae]|uniref:immunoglobulin-like domain-containing protein n=1 Tax=Listeria booriae TaxID=1552123 RepID=UPI001629E379|nr:immunoglobulin-like domain-containing protein [Listeria booriae]MBC1358215.1 hypothetical protein [Listeria booriae]